jgi:hypothetical protein
MSRCLCCSSPVTPVINNVTLGKCHYCLHHQLIDGNETKVNVYNDTDLEWLLNSIMEKPKSSIVEIGRHSGILEILKTEGFETFTSLNWSLKYASKLDKFDFVLAIDVLPDTVSPFDFLCGCKEVLAIDGSIFIQIPYHNFKEVRHSYFSIKSFEKILYHVGLHVHSIHRVNPSSWLFEVKDKLKRRIQPMEQLLVEEESFQPSISTAITSTDPHLEHL